MRRTISPIKEPTNSHKTCTRLQYKRRKDAFRGRTTASINWILAAIRLHNKQLPVALFWWTLGWMSFCNWGNNVKYKHAGPAISQRNGRVIFHLPVLFSPCLGGATGRAAPRPCWLIYFAVGGWTGRWDGCCSASTRHLHLHPPLNKSSLRHMTLQAWFPF